MATRAVPLYRCGWNKVSDSSKTLDHKKSNPKFLSLYIFIIVDGFVYRYSETWDDGVLIDRKQVDAGD